jgi:class 3 adenylate cyclase
MNVTGWLRDLGLSQYEAAFRDNAVDDTDILRELTDADLEKLGVRLGHRKRILRATAALGDAAADGGAVGAAAERRQLTVLFCDLAGSTAPPPGSTRRTCGA